ncbi:MAG: YraN family protein [Hyphomicrobiaceae bacterium]
METASTYDTPASGARLDRRLQERRARYRTGLWAEFAAAIYLSLKGYRILARRYKTHSGEIDLIAVRGGVVAFVEVKARLTFAAAEFSISPRQSKRIRCAAARWTSRSPRYREFEQRFDALYILPGRFPAHLEGGA